MRPAIFLDRDGVIIENCPNYVRTWEDVQIFEQAISALADLANSKYAIVIVTNQSAIGRGIITNEQAHSINARLVQTIVQAGGRVDGVFMCPHKPEDECQCRKPKPGLLLQAANELFLDLSQSIMIGDAFTDLLAGQNARVQQVALVHTGRGLAQSKLAPPPELKPYSSHNTLADALHILLTA
ncbi:MAG: D-glycero-beta-D-manno-heptose 1,7-bisphosphate 7-phosphatase [Anaerolineales bacterium]